MLFWMAIRREHHSPCFWIAIPQLTRQISKSSVLIRGIDSKDYVFSYLVSGKVDVGVVS